ncbi:hypothetical protein IFR23_09485 [Sphingomonas sp. CFBP 13603]|nr:hypothetical protein [Sphingomonas sp. CFBP 13603]MBE2992251.1 hypothetical protein [Sphingomonas sp. CFBP 13603]
MHRFHAAINVRTDGIVAWVRMPGVPGKKLVRIACQRSCHDLERHTMPLPSKLSVAQAMIVTAATAFSTTLCLLAVVGPVYERSAHMALSSPHMRPSALA